MSEIAKYPNPLRVFSQTRDIWLVDLIESFGIPMHIFSAVRDSQLGQLMFALESVKRKQRRSGETDVPNFLDQENAAAFIQVFSLIKQFQDFIDQEDIPVKLSDFSAIKKHEHFKEFTKLKKTPHNWFSTLPEDYLDQVYISASQVFDLILQAIGEKLELDNETAVLDKIGESQENFKQVIETLLPPGLVELVISSTFERDEKDATTRIFQVNDEPVSIPNNEFHGRVNLLYSLILEFERLFTKKKKYSFEFNSIEALLTTEMLIMYPRPDKNFLPVIKDHLKQLSKETDYPKVFWDIISINYQTFTQLEESGSRMLKKVYQNLEKSMKDSVRSFWKTIDNLMEKGDQKKAEQMISVLWAHFRAVQTQAQHMEEQQYEHSHSQSHTATVRMEHIFWLHGKRYLEPETFQSPTQFWSAYASIANKQIRSKADSLNLFEETDELLKNARVLTNKTVRKKLDVNNADRFSLIQRILSYGLEARDDTIYPRIEKYVDTLEKLLGEIDAEEMHSGFNMDQEKQVVDSIRTHLKNPLPQES